MASVFRSSARAVITGGASGIGYAVAELCLKHSMRVVIADYNQDLLDIAQKTLKGDFSCMKIDVGNRDDWKRLKEHVDEVDFLMLNAGIVSRGTWGDVEYFDQTLNTNLNGVINGLNTYVPSFQSRASSEASAIVITGSKQGITNPPGNAAYNASKAAVKALAEHLDYDLRDTRTSVHLLVPGWTFTGLSGNVPGSNKQKPDGAWSSAQVADYMYKKMSDDKFYIICPDNDVSEATDKRRILWSVGDIVNERPPLTRWRARYKQEVEDWMRKQELEK